MSAQFNIAVPSYVVKKLDNFTTGC